MRHCIVTPELVHLTPRGEGGIDSYYLAQFLSREAGDEVTLFYTGEVQDPGSWRQRFKQECGADLVTLNELAPIPLGSKDELADQVDSLRIYRWLRDQTFDAIHFQHQGALGFCSIQAKRLGEAFEQTHLIAIAPGPSQWVNEEMERHPSGTLKEIALEYMERYCAEHCDTLVVHSPRILQWMNNAGWKLCPDHRVIPAYFPKLDPIKVPPLNPRHLVFAGRLERRTGLRIFTEAAKRYAHWLKTMSPESSAPLRLSFVGSIGQKGEYKASTYLEETLASAGESLVWEIHSELSHQEMLMFLESNADALFVFPATEEHFSFTHPSVTMRGLHQLSAVEGQDENQPCPYHFKPTIQSLFEKLCETFEKGLSLYPSSTEPDRIKALYLDLLGSVKSQAQLRIKAKPRVEKELPLISVCVPVYNTGSYLPATLECLAQQTYPSFEVVVVDDGSTCESTQQVFDSMQALYAQRGWKFIKKPKNSGLALTRNEAVAHTSGEFIAFVDSDNLPLPEMLTALHQGLEYANLDCITSYVYSFVDGQSSRKEDLALLRPFLGNCPEGALFKNVMGDANLLVRRTVFEKVGGFLKTRGATLEDLSFLLRVSFAGYRIDSSSSILFAYRVRRGSLTWNSNHFWNRRVILDVVTERLEPWAKKIFFHKFSDPKRAGDPEHLASKVMELREKHWTERKKRRESEEKAKKLSARLKQLRANRWVRWGERLGFIDLSDL